MLLPSLPTLPECSRSLIPGHSATAAEVREFEEALRKQFPASVLKSKSWHSTSCTSRRQPTNNVTGDYRQASRIQKQIEQSEEYVEAQKPTLEEALFKEGLTAKAQRDLSVLTEEERIRILRHIGTEPLTNDQYSRLPLVIEHLSPAWNHEESILYHPGVDGKPFKFPVINQQALFVRKCYHELYEIVTKLPTTVESLRILLTGTPGIGKSTFLIYFIIRHLYESTIAPDSRKNPAVRDVLIFQPAKSGK
jgi:hypothetical protein